MIRGNSNRRTPWRDSKRVTIVKNVHFVTYPDRLRAILGMNSQKDPFVGAADNAGGRNLEVAVLFGDLLNVFQRVEQPQELLLPKFVDPITSRLPELLSLLLTLSGTLVFLELFFITFVHKVTVTSMKFHEVG